MSNRRIERLNSLLKEVISDVIHTEVKNPRLPPLITITRVDVTKDLRHAKVYVSVIGENKNEAIDVLKSAAGFIAVQAAKQIVIRYFPELKFILDDTVDQQMRIDRLLSEIHAKRGDEEHE